MRERKIGSSYGFTFAKRIRQILPGLLLFISVAAFAQPANDPCNMATPVPVAGCVAGDLFGATFDLLNLDCIPPGAANVWYSFTAQGMDYTIDLAGLGGVGQISLMQFTMGPCQFVGATQVDCGGENITGNNVLNVGQQYFVLVTTTDASEGGFNLCLDNPVDPPPPPNDDPCAATPVPANGTCTTGTTADANSDWVVPGCEGIGTNTVWYSVTLGPTSNSLDVVLGNQTILGDASVIIGNFPSGCANNFVGNASYCGDPNTTVSATNLTPGTTYFVMIGSSDPEAGIFDVCITEMGPPPACLAIAECNTAQPINVISNQMTVCVPGCNNSVSFGGCAGQGPTVYYSVTTDASASLMNVNVGSPGMFSPSVGIFLGCGGGLVGCNTGVNNSVELNTVSVMPGTTYIIAVTDPLTNGSDFDLCVSIVPAGFSNCSANNVTLTPTVSAPGAPFQPGETVNVCLESTWTADPIGAGNDCQWLHGITPEFGNCWDPASFVPGSTNQPFMNVTTNIGPVFDWYEGGIDYNIVGYLNPGDIAPPGWFTSGTPGNDPGCTDFTDPNCTFGASQGCGSVANWFICFDLVTKSYPLCENNTDCAVTFRTWGDGETGGWSQQGCQLDIPITQNANLNCCAPPTLVITPQTTCSDVQISLDLSQFVIFPAITNGITYTWTVINSPGSVTGAGACSTNCGSVFSQLLSNSSTSPQTVTFGITATTVDGCTNGTPVELDILVLPGIDINIPQPPAACSGSEAILIATATGGSGSGYSYDWGPEGTGPSITVIPAISTPYTVTVTDGNGCEAVETVLVEANPTLDVDIVASQPSACVGDFAGGFPIQLIATANVGFNWTAEWTTPIGTIPTACGGGSCIFNATVATAVPFEYCVTITDIPTGCTGTECITIHISDAPTVIVIAPDNVCQGTDPVNVLSAITIPGSGTGVWSSVPPGLVDADGNFVPSVAGPVDVTYTFTADGTGCVGTATETITVLPLPDNPIANSGPTTLCQNAAGQFCVLPSAFADGYNWVLPPGVVATGPTDGICIDVNWNTINGDTIFVGAQNTCGASLDSAMFIVDITPVPDDATIIGGPIVVCANDAGASYTTPANPNANGYNWTVTGGSIASGQNSTAISVNWGAGPTGEVCVTPSNDCGSANNAYCIQITINDIPDLPALPVGPTPICAGVQGITYTGAATTGATSYLWTVTGGTIVGSNTGLSIDIDWGNGTSGLICFEAINDCGAQESCLPVIIQDIPGNPTPIDVDIAVVCVGTQGVNYSITGATNADSYVWTVTDGTIIGASNGTAIVVDWMAVATGNEEVCVYATNVCGNSSATACLPVVLGSPPVAPVPPANTTACADDTGVNFSITPVIGATGYNWFVNSGDATISGSNTGTSVNVNFGSSDSEICINAINDCGPGAQDCFTVTITDVPADPSTPSGVIDVCVGDTEMYATSPLIAGVTYTWSIIGNGTIDSGQGTDNVQVTWGNGPTGEICISAENNCGPALSNPNCLAVNISDIPADPGTISGSDDLCQGDLGENYSITAVTGATSYLWTVTNGTISGANDGTSISVDWGLMTSGEVCVIAINDCGNSLNDQCLQIVLDDLPATPVAPGNTEACAGDSNVDFNIGPITGATAYNWFVNSGDATISGSNTGSGVTIDFGSTDSEICVNAINDCGSGAQDCFTVTINDVPADPATPTGVIDVCTGDTETYSTDPLMAGVTYTWSIIGDGTIDSGQGTDNVQVTWGNGPTGEICISAENNCGPALSNPNCLTINISDIPADPGAISGLDDLCQGDLGENYSITPVTGATSYLWTVTNGTINGANDGTSISVDWGLMTTGEVCVIAINDCGNSLNDECLPIVLDDLPATPIAPGNTEACAGDNNVDFSIAAVAGATSYNWFVNSGDATISGSNSGTTVSVNFGSTDSEICVNAINDCGPGAQDCFTVTINDIPADPTGLIGETEVCPGDIENYSIDAIAMGVTLNWTVTGGTLNSGQGTTGIEVTWGTGTSGTVQVTASNNCGDSQNSPVLLNININEIPADPGAIVGNNPICEGDIGSIYSIAGVAGATSYVWTVTNGTINGPSDGTSIEIDWDNMSTGRICVIAVNECGNSLNDSCLDIILESIPAAPMAPQNSVACAGDLGVAFGINTVTGATDYDWQVVSGDAMITSGSMSTDIVVNFGSTTSEICVSAGNQCGSSGTGCFTITVNNAPDLPVFTQGNDEICEGATNETYAVMAVTDATDYIWTVPAGAVILSGNGTPSIDVDWGSAIGTGLVVSCVIVNDCGTNIENFIVDVDQALDAPIVDCNLGQTDLNQVAFDVNHPTATDFDYTWTNTTTNDMGAGTVNIADLPIIISGLNPLDNVEIVVIALGGTNICGDSPAFTWDCSANDCVEADPDFSPITQTVFCVTDAPYQLEAIPTGGTWSGTGVDASGLFTPATAGVGPVFIVYNYTDATGCDQSGTIELTVVGPIDPPMVTCMVTSPTEITFTITHTDPTITSFEYSTSEDPTLMVTNTGIVVVSGLSNGQSVTLTAAAIGPAPCGNSTTNDAFCQIPPCVNVDPTFVNVDAEYCIDDNSLIQLQATPAGGTWSGMGVDADGTFHPDGFTMAGTTTLTYMWVDLNTNCAQQGDITIGLVAPLGNPDVSCVSSTQSSVTFGITLPPGATDYTYTYFVEPAGAVQGPFPGGSMATQVIPAGLNDNITLTVIAIGTGVCGDSQPASNTCQANGCTFITPDVPNAGSYCSDALPVVFAGNPAGGVFSGTGVMADGTFDPGTGGVYNLTYTYTDALGCESPTTFQITVEDAIQGFEVSCGLTGTDFVTFDWSTTTGGATQFEYTWENLITGMTGGPITTMDVSTIVNGLNVNDVVEITVIAFGDAPCGNATFTHSCQAQDCPTGINPTISGAAGPYCVGDAGIQLAGLPAGGDFSGDDVSVSGLFTPTTAGTAMVTYTYIDPSGCAYPTTIPIDVIAPLAPPTVSCGNVTASTVSFNISGGASYAYTYTTDLAGSGSGTSNGPTIDIGGLVLNETVTISVEIVGPAPCGNSPASTTDCTAFDCPQQSIVFPNVPTFCENGALAAVQLVANVIGGDGITQGVWSGACVTPTGMFDPSSCSTAGTYTITYTYEQVATCEISNSMVIEVFAPPVAEAGSSDPWQCGFTSIALDAVTGTSSGADIMYSWTASGPGAVVGNPTSLTPDVDGPGTYTLTVTNMTTGCVATDAVVVDNDVDAPVVTVANGFISCNPTELTFTLEAEPNDPMFTYLWTGPGITLANMDMQNPTVDIAGGYTVVVTLPNGCSGQGQAQVADLQVDPVAVIDSPVNTITCMTNPFNMSAIDCNGADPDLVYAWYFSGTLLSNGCSILVEEPGEYTLEVSNSVTGCFAETSQMVVDAVAFPIAGAVATDDLDCLISEVEISGASSQTGNTISYEWTGPDILSDPTAQNITVGMGGFYTLTVYESVSECSNDTMVFVEDFSGILPLADAGDDQELPCGDDAIVELLGSGTGGIGNLEFSWSNSDDEVISNAAEVTVDAIGEYTLMVTDTETGCEQPSSVLVVPNSNNPVGLDLDAEGPNCVENLTSGFINISGVLGGDAPYIYSFNGEAYSSQTFQANLAPGNYELAIEDANGCVYEQTVTLPEPDVVSVDLLQDTEIISELEFEYGDSSNVVSAQIAVPIDQVQSIVWTPEWAVECALEPCTEVTIQSGVSTNITATVITVDGCEAEARIDIIVKKSSDVYFPSAFSPNNAGDAINETYGPMFNNENVESVEKFMIVDRWGEIVFIRENLDPNNPLEELLLFWDGNLKGEPMNPGVFVYYAVVNFKNGVKEELKGDFTLFR